MCTRRSSHRLLAAATLALLGTLPAPVPAAAQSADSIWLAGKGFHLRRNTGPVLHMDADEVTGQRTASVARLLARSDRIEVRRFGGDVQLLLGSPPSAAATTDPCRLEIYVNGLREGRRGQNAALIFDGLLRVPDLDGVEVYDAAHAPVGSPAGCGVVLFWSYAISESWDEEFASYVRGRAVHVPAETAAAGVVVTLEPGDFRRTTDDAGRFDFGAIAAARYTLTATATDGTTTSTLLDVRAFGVADLVIEIEALATRRGRL